MSTRYLKILLPLFFAQSIVAQLPSHLDNHGFQSLPAQDISQNSNGQPSCNNFPGVSNIPFINNLPINGNSQVSGLQMIPKLPFINGQINDLLNFASNINNRQIAGNNPSTLIQSSPINNKLQQPFNGLPVNNNLFNNVPNNIVSAANNMPSYNLPVYSNAFNPNTFQYHLSENNNVPLPNLPINKAAKINSLTLSGEAFNNGMPFNVVPANVAFNNVNDVPVKNYFNYNNGPNNGLKITRSLSANEVPEIDYPIASNIIENNVIPAWQNYNNEVNTVNPPQNNINNHVLSVNNGLPLNNGLPYLAPTASNAPTVLPLSESYPANSMLGNGESTNSFTNRNFNNIQPHNEQILNNLNSYQIPLNKEWHQPLNLIQSYQNNDLSLANLPINNVGFSQPHNEQILNNLNNYQMPLNKEWHQPLNPIQSNPNNDLSLENLPMNNVGFSQPHNEQILNKLNNYQMPLNKEWQQPLNLIQSYQNNDQTLANLPMNNVGFSQSAGINLNLQDLANLNVLNLGGFGSLPVFSGLPVIGVTETVTVINPDQFNQNHILSY